MRLFLKTIFPVLAVSVFLAGCAGPSPEATAAAESPNDGEWIQLFNGTDLTGWETYLGPRLDANLEKIPGSVIGVNKDPDNVFTVTELDGGPVIRISGVIGGGINTVQEYENYHLRMQVKWGAGNPWNRTTPDSGILYHAGGEHGLDGDYWMRSVEYQVMPERHGDLITILGVVADASTAPPAEEGGRYTYDPNGQSRTFSRVAEMSEFGGAARRLEGYPDPVPPGEWLTLEVYTLGQTGVHVVGGKVVLVVNNIRLHENGVTNPLTRGKIQIQSEGSEVFYRNLELRQISELPAGLIDQPAPAAAQ
jgi:hypothetical protein